MPLYRAETVGGQHFMCRAKNEEAAKLPQTDSISDIVKYTQEITEDEYDMILRLGPNAVARPWEKKTKRRAWVT